MTTVTNPMNKATREISDNPATSKHHAASANKEMIAAWRNNQIQGRLSGEYWLFISSLWIGTAANASA